jgi:hypothetical protein
LCFVEQQNGADTKWIIDSGSSLAEVANTLRASGLVPATVRKRQNGSEILFVDFDSHFTNKLRALASALNGSVSLVVGTGALPGDDDRKVAAGIFQTNIRRVEKGDRKYHLSSQLWTENWHDANSRTCSTDIPLQ